VDRFINKLLLNGLYGYNGRKVERNIGEVLDYNEFMEKSSKFRLNHMILLDENKNDYLIVRENIVDQELCELSGVSYKEAVLESMKEGDMRTSSNVAIAASITSYARIVMSKLKLRKDLDIHYIDTDCL